MTRSTFEKKTLLSYFILAHQVPPGLEQERYVTLTSGRWTWNRPALMELTHYVLKLITTYLKENGRAL